MLKTKFKLECLSDKRNKSIIEIVGKAPTDTPYVIIDIDAIAKYDSYTYFIPDKDLERFAVNILKAIRSKKLNPTV